MQRYAIVANQTLDSDQLVSVVQDRAAQGPAEFWLVVPATPVKDLASNAVADPDAGDGRDPRRSPIHPPRRASSRRPSSTPR